MWVYITHTDRILSGSNANILSQKCFKTLYFSLVSPYLSYGLILWGNAQKKFYNRLIIIQKKALTLVCKKRYNYPTEELFKDTGIFKINDLYVLEILKLMFRLHTGLSPASLFDSFDMKHNIHNHNTRFNNMIHLPSKTGSCVLNSVLTKGPRLWTKLPVEIRNANNIRIFCNKLKILLKTDRGLCD